MVFLHRRRAKELVLISWGVGRGNSSSNSISLDYLLCGWGEWLRRESVFLFVGPLARVVGSRVGKELGGVCG